ncbi:MAG: YbaK/EbsC family protein [Actinobacteria bacterium]|nr:YbaK/EbsC family protein [Actinomycetota bacterium]
MRSSVDVHNHLVERDVPHELMAAGGRLRSAERIAAVLDLPASQVGKVVVLEGEGGPVAALVASDREPDLERVASALSRDDLSAVNPTRASQLTGYLSEAIPPVGLPSSFRVVIDELLASREVLYFHGGEATALLKIRGADLVRAADAAVAPIAGRG